MASDCDGVPFERPWGYALGRELYSLIAANCVTKAALDARHSLVKEMLASDPLHIFDIVPAPASGADRLLFSVVIRDDFRFDLTHSADDAEGCHNSTPIDSNASEAHRVGSGSSPA